MIFLEKIRYFVKLFVAIFLFCGLFSGNSLYGKEKPRKIPSEGKFMMSEKIGADLIKVTIYIKRLKIAKSSFPPSEERENNCTYSRIPCSLVVNLTIELNGKHVAVGRTPFADLSDLNEAELKKNGQRYVLTLYGGDASESYIVNIEFDAKRVLTREVFSALAPDAILERTQFFEFEL